MDDLILLEFHSTDKSDKTMDQKESLITELASSLLEIESDDEIFKNVEKTDTQTILPIIEEKYVDTKISSVVVESSNRINSSEHNERNATQEQQHGSRVTSPNKVKNIKI